MDGCSGEIKAMLRDTKTCLTCGEWLKAGHGRNTRVGYCSKVCYQAKPPKMAMLERMHGKPIRQVVIDTLNSTRSKEAAAGLLGVGRSRFYQWIAKLKIKEVTVYE